MKRTVRVTVEKEIDIEFKDELLTPEFVKEFESFLFELDGNTHEEKLDELFKFAAKELFYANWSEDFVEALGDAVGKSSVGQSYLKNTPESYTIVYEQTHEEYDAEFV